mgnify:CR=1 FL=1
MSRDATGLVTLRRALQRPQEMAGFSGQQWDHVIRLARAGDLSARLGFLAQRDALVPGGTAGSPTPAGCRVLGTMWVSTTGDCFNDSIG